MLIRDSHDDADRYVEDTGNAQSQEKTVPRKVDRVVLDDKYSNSKHGDKCNEIPVHRRIFVSSHQAAMHILASAHHVLSVYHTS
jgi:hypothetical protein